MHEFRTDLADERCEICKTNLSKGIKNATEQISSNISVTRVEILNEEASKILQKDIGNYVTINIKDVNYISNEDLEEMVKCFSKELKNIIKFDGSILVVGLGNAATTADSIGPKVTQNLKITRHIIKYEPDLLPKNTREMCAIAPGVLGTTGIETQEIIKGIIEKVKVAGIIVIDALASNNVSRLMKTIQIADTGITPGAGVSNRRKEISKKTMNIPVIAVGVLAVVSTETIVRDTLKMLNIEKDYKTIKNVLEDSKFDLVVMPKEIDELVDNMKEIISKGINNLT